MPSGDTVRYIVKWYRATHPDVPVPPAVEGPVPAVRASIVDRELKEANLKIRAFGLLIANINGEVGLDVVKKFGTKQPRR